METEIAYWQPVGKDTAFVKSVYECTSVWIEYLKLFL